jgi:hypothetical protein
MIIRFSGLVFGLLAFPGMLALLFWTYRVHISFPCVNFFFRYEESVWVNTRGVTAALGRMLLRETRISIDNNVFTDG